MSKIIRFERGSIILYTRFEVAQILGVTPRTVSNYIRSGRIPAQVIGKDSFISQSNLVAFLHGAKPSSYGERTGYHARRGQHVNPPSFQKAEFSGNKFPDI